MQGRKPRRQKSTEDRPAGIKSSRLTTNKQGVAAFSLLKALDDADAKPGASALALRPSVPPVCGQADSGVKSETPNLDFQSKGFIRRSEQETERRPIENRSSGRFF